MKTAFFVAALALAPAALPAGLKLGLRPPTFLPVPDEHAISVPEATMLAENPGDGYLCAPSVVAVRSTAMGSCFPTISTKPAVGSSVPPPSAIPPP